MTDKKKYLCASRKSLYYIVYETAENHPINHQER